MKKLLLVVVVLTTLLSACGGGSSVFEPVTDEAGGVLTLAEEGEGDRIILAYDLKLGQVDTLELTFDMSINQNIVGVGANSTDLPNYTLILSQEVTDITLEGHYEITATVEDIIFNDEGSNSAVFDNTELLFADLLGLETVTVMTRRGVILSSTTPGLATIDPAMREAMSQFEDQASEITAPLPPFEVGVGASWTYEASYELGGITGRGTTTFEVREINGTVVTMRVTGTEEADRQRIDIPGAPAGAELELRELDSTFSGAISVDLTASVAATTMLSEATVDMRISAEGQSVDLTQGTTVRITGEVR